MIRGSGELCLDNAAAGQLLVCDGGIRLRAASMAQAVSCSLSAVSAGLEVTAEPVPDSPTLNAVLHLSCSEPLPLGAARQLQLQWLLGETVLGEESVVLTDSADLWLAAPIRYDQPLPKDEITFNAADYADIDEKNRAAILEEIKRKDEAFYEQWLHYDS